MAFGVQGLTFFLLFFGAAVFFTIMRFLETASSLFVVATGQLASAQSSNASVDLSWHVPLSSHVNDLSTVINGTGTYGFLFNSSTLPDGVPYGTYNLCNMPHVRRQEYPRVNESFQLKYVEVIHRHHKRTPYASNTFPWESYPWDCDDEGLFYSGAPLPVQNTNQSANTFWSVYTSPSNPLAPQGFNGTCQFPQITRGGLDDSWQHGRDLFSVYHDLLNFLPTTYDPTQISFRVTNNVITSQVASMLIAGMFPSETHQNVPLLVQPNSIDSLEPAYSCPAATSLYYSFASGSSSPAWTAHLAAASSLYSALDSISGISPSASDWHVSFDHYFDNLSSRLCHAKPLPCNINNPDLCVTAAQAEEVFRLGEYEYSYTYRDAGQQTLDAAVASYGIWIAELAQNIRHAVNPSQSPSTGNATSKIKYRHNVAHDGSVSRLLSILQVETMVWPGMGSEVVFELYQGATKSDDKWYVRVLWGGQILRSSNPSLGPLDMLPAETLLAYFDGLAGINASKIPTLCEAS